MFWGLTLKPGKRHTEVLTEEICLSMATLESRKNFGERPDNYSHVVVKRGKMDYLLCTLVHGLQFQQNLNLKLMPKEKITFKVQGTSQVYLTGFTPTCPVDDIEVEEGDEEEEEEEEEEEAMEQPVEPRQIGGRGDEMGWLMDDPEPQPDPVEDVIESLSGEEFPQSEEQSVVEQGASQQAGTQGGGSNQERSTREDNFLSVAELGTLPLKVEIQDEPESQKMDKTTTNNNEALNTTTEGEQPSATRGQGDVSSGDESDNDWILDDHIQPVPEGAVAETEFNVDVEGTVSYPCNRCGQRFATDPARIQHERSSHPTPPVGPPPLIRMTNEGIKYQCKYCSKLLANRNTLKRHEALHRGNRMNISCKHCLKVCNNSYNRMRHETVCGKKAALKARFPAGSKRKVYRCLICDIAFDQIQVRDKHVLGHFKKDAARCDRCRQVTCRGECSQSAGGEGILNSSQPPPVVNASSEATAAPDIHSRRLWKCQFCPKLFTLKGSRNRHHRKAHMASSSSVPNPNLKRVAAVTAATSAVDSSLAAENDGKECKYCYRAFQSDVLLKTHERTHIGEERPFSCKCCKKTFMDHLGRRKHELRHPEMRRFSCKFCHRRFSKANLWEIHESHHTEARPYKCRFCARDFSNQSNRTNHETAHKTRGDTELAPTVSVDSALPDGIALPSNRSPTGKLARLPCRICGKRFVTNGGRHKHERNVHRLHGGSLLEESSSGSISCNLCGIQFATQVQLAMHTCSSSVPQSFTCRTCNGKFGDRGSLLRHQATHTQSVGSKQCRYCKKVLSSRYAVVVHERIHTGERPFGCNQCDFRTNDKSHLSKHVKRHSSPAPYTLKCSICSHKFMSQYSLKIHEAQHKAERMILTCPECDMKFPSREDLEVHQQSHAIEVSTAEPVAANENSAGGETSELDGDDGGNIESIDEDSVGVIAVADGSPDVAQETQGSEEDFRPYRCTYCDATFPAPGGLRDHEAQHEREQPFKCDKCGRSFKTNMGLEKHSQVCLEGKPYQCRYCSKCFSTEKGCHLHEDSHIVQRPFKCSRCERGFLSTHSREMHEKTHTL